MQLYSPKKGSIIFDIGLIDIESPGTPSMEFSRDYGEEITDYRKEGVEQGYQTLKRTKNHNYRSTIQQGRTEKQDRRILDKIQKRFSEYVVFNGEYLFKDMHSHYIFGKLIEIDYNKIKKQERYPENKLEEIKTYLFSLIPKKARRKY